MAQKAVPTKSKLRAAFSGPPGSGKTYTSLCVATELNSILKESGYSFGNGRIAVLESERGRASVYAKASDDDDYGFDFDMDIIRDFSPESYIEGIYKLDREGYTFIIVDQITSEWNAKGGILDLHGKIVGAKGEKYNYFAWRDVTPRHNSFVESLMSTNAHLICNIRAKYKLVYDNGKIENVGLRPIQRKDLDYEFDVHAMLDMKHTASFRKSRCPGLDGKKFELPGRNVAEILAAWMLRGVGKPKSPEATLPYQYIKEIKELWEMLKYSPDSLSAAIKKRGIESGRLEDMSVDAAIDLTKALRNKACVATDVKQITDSLAASPSPRLATLPNGDVSPESETD